MKLKVYYICSMENHVYLSDRDNGSWFVKNSCKYLLLTNNVVKTWGIKSYVYPPPIK